MKALPRKQQIRAENESQKKASDATHHFVSNPNQQLLLMPGDGMKESQMAKRVINKLLQSGIKIYVWCFKLPTN